ncbi:MAG: hypothetical protein ACYTAQ_03660 [Planctomycetota bacterium]
MKKSLSALERLLADRIAVPGLQGRVHLAADRLELHAGPGERPGDDHLVAGTGEVDRAPVKTLRGRVGHVVAGHLHRRLAGDDGGSPDL